MTAIELAIQDGAGAQVACDIGADRVELCSGLALGGLTPSMGLIEHVVGAGIETHVLIRPRAGGFVYSDAEVALMETEITHALSVGAAGVVVGVLDDAGWPHLGFLARLVEAAAGVEVTFHRAIDVARDPVVGATMLQEAGVVRVLTSGGAPTATAGSATLARMVAECRGKLQIQAGGGITPDNVQTVLATGVDAVHFSAKRQISGPAHPAVDFGGYDVTDARIAHAIMSQVRSGN